MLASCYGSVFEKFSAETGTEETAGLWMCRQVVPGGWSWRQPSFLFYDSLILGWRVWSKTLYKQQQSINIQGYFCFLVALTSWSLIVVTKWIGGFFRNNTFISVYSLEFWQKEPRSETNQQTVSGHEPSNTGLCPAHGEWERRFLTQRAPGMLGLRWNSEWPCGDPSCMPPRAVVLNLCRGIHFACQVAIGPLAFVEKAISMPSLVIFPVLYRYDKFLISFFSKWPSRCFSS